jgi:hypothetical protein
MSSSVATFIATLDGVTKSAGNTITENGLPAYTSTGSSCLDLFAKTIRGMSTTDIHEMFKNAFIENAKVAIQIAFNTRDCIGNGKQEKDLALHMMEWLKINKPLNYLKNLPEYLNISCFKDLLKLACTAPNKIINDVEFQLFAAYLKDDLQKLNNYMAALEAASNDDEKKKIIKVILSLAAKWAPTEGCSFDKKIKAAHKIAIIMGLSMKNYRKALSKIRAYQNILERYESFKQWDKINFEHVPATAMKKQKKAFEKHCSEQFANYLAKVMAGKAKMHTKGIQPHELVSHYMIGHEPIDPTIEAQWSTIVSTLKTAGLFKDAVAVCDVSGSMSGIPLHVAIALGLIVSQMTLAPFNNKIITFSAVPTWHEIKGDNLQQQVHNLAKAAWDMNTDFLAVFKMLLTEAKTYKLSPEQMIKKIFVFSDMQFDQATDGPSYMTGFGHIKKMYEDAGYAIPTIVFWNLRDTKVSFPVQKDTPNVALMSGFSSEMLKVFLEDGDMTPESIMLRAVSGYKVTVIEEA